MTPSPPPRSYCHFGAKEAVAGGHSPLVVSLQWAGVRHRAVANQTERRPLRLRGGEEKAPATWEKGRQRMARWGAF